MIFVTAGGVKEFDFSRVFIILDNIKKDERFSNMEIIAQIGHSKYEPKNYKWFRFVDNKKFDDYISNADIVITHGGIGTLIKAMNLNRKIIAFPRLKKYNEHLDNHQCEIVNKLAEEKYIISAIDENSLIESLLEIKDFQPKKWKNDNRLMINIIDEYLKTI